MRQSSSSSSSKKPISSPGRALFDKFPPPLIRFLRSKSTKPKSKSKSKPRTPLFFRKKKPTSVTQQEPSSPKVTCIGQVRVRRASRRRRRPNDKRRCSFAGKCTLCPNTKKWFRFLWRKCVSFFCCRADKVRTEPESNRVEECEIRNRPDEVERQKLGFTASEITPPKNALMLTRCRSAPYRSSSLACRLWGHDEEEKSETPAHETEIILSVSNSAAVERDSAAENKEEREEKVGSPPLLSTAMRCRSEPVRRGSERLDPLTSEFWRERRRLSNTDSLSS